MGAGPPSPHFPHFWSHFFSSRKWLYLNRSNPWLTPWYFFFSGNFIGPCYLAQNQKEKNKGKKYILAESLILTPI